MFKVAIVGWVALFVAGCGGGSPTEPPPPPMNVTVDGTVDRVNTQNAVSGDWECDITLTANTFNGVPGEFATWISGEVVFDWTDGTPRSTTLINTNALLDFWGSDRIRVGQQQVATRLASSAFTFDLIYTFRLLMPDGETKSTTTFLDCQP